MDVVRADAEPGLRILLVERNPIDAAVLAQLLRASQGTSGVVRAESYSAVAEVLEREAIDTIFCSVAARDMAVFRALIRAAEPRPVVALIAEAMSEIRNQAIEAGAVLTLCKESLLASFAQRMVRGRAGVPRQNTGLRRKSERLGHTGRVSMQFGSVRQRLDARRPQLDMALEELWE